MFFSTRILFPTNPFLLPPTKTDSVRPIDVLDFSPIQPTHAKSNPATIASPTTPLRRSQRAHVPPVALSDYVCNQVSSSESLSFSPFFPCKGT